MKWVFLVNEDTRLQLGARCLAVRIFSLARKEGYCWAYNNYLAKEIGCSKPTITRWLRQLKDYGYIEVDVLQSTGNNRKIFPKNPPITSDKTPMITDDSASTHIESDSSLIEDDSSDHEGSDPLITAAQHNKKKEQEETNKKKEQEDDVDAGGNKLSSEQNILLNSIFPHLPNSAVLIARLRKLLLSETPFNKMGANDVALVILSFYSGMGKSVLEYEQQAKHVRELLEHAPSPGIVMAAIWKAMQSMKANDRKEWETGWDLAWLKKSGSLDKVFDDFDTKLELSLSAKELCLCYEHLIIKNVASLKIDSSGYTLNRKLDYSIDPKKHETDKPFGHTIEKLGMHTLEEL